MFLIQPKPRGPHSGVPLAVRVGIRSPVPVRGRGRDVHGAGAVAPPLVDGVRGRLGVHGEREVGLRQSRPLEPDRLRRGGGDITQSDTQPMQLNDLG